MRRNKIFLPDPVIGLLALFFIILSSNFCWALDHTFLSDTVIAANDHTYDGYNIIVGDGVNPVTLITNGPHSFASLTIKNSATVTHGATDTTTIGILNLIISEDMEIQPGGKINADGRGYLGGYQAGNNSVHGRTRGNQTANGSSGGDGGSHGGYGGVGSNGDIGWAYGDLMGPSEPGSGGGSFNSNHLGGNGGGLIRMTVSGTLTNNGLITADGASPGGYVAGGGSGGGIYVNVGTLLGNGAITANGGSGGTYGGYAEGGGGGGRIALYYGIDNFTGIISAYGGQGNNGGNNGGAGTIFRKPNSQTYGDFEVKNNLPTPDISTPTPFEVWRGTSDASGGITATVLTDSAASWTSNEFSGFILNPNLKNNETFYIISNTATTITVSGDMTLIAVGGDAYAVAHPRFNTVTISGTSFVGFDDFSLTASVLNIMDTAVLTHFNAATDSASQLLLDLIDATIAAGAKIDMNGRGYLGGYQGGNGTIYGRTRGNQTANGSSGGAGGSHGGYGGIGSNGDIGWAYGDLMDPLEPGSGGGSFNSNHLGGNGGGLIRMTVSGTLTNNGLITADGASPGGYVAGGGAGGGIYCDVGTLLGSGTITANGGSGGTYGGYAEGGGGGGRIALYYGIDNFTGTISAYGGQGNNGGNNAGAGTIFRKKGGQAFGDFEIRNNLSTPDISTPTPFEVWRGASDEINGITSTILTDSAADWTPGALAGMILNSNLKQNETFVIIANTATTITVSGDMSTSASAGDSYAVAHPRFNIVTLSGKSFVGFDDFSLTANLLQMTDTAVLTHFNAAIDAAPQLLLDLTDANIATGAKIDVDSRGYLGGYQGGNASTYGRTRGNQIANGSYHGAGGSHGGYGGMGSGGTIGIAYDDLADPWEPGAGGGSWGSGHYGGNGGGLIRMMVSGTLTNNGVITSNGASGMSSVAGGGAGGGIRLDVGTLVGSGTVTANGGSGGTYGGYAEGGGGGGRIAIYYETDTFSGVISAFGGNGNNGGNNAGAGSIFKKQPSQSYGNFEVRNNLPTPDISTPTPFEVWRGTSDPTGGITTAVLTDSAASWKPGEFIGFILNPNLKENAIFPIMGNTATTITVSGDMTLFAVSGDAYAVAHPRFDTVTFSGTSFVGLDDFVLTASILNILQTAVLTHFNATPDTAPLLRLDLGNLTVDSTARIDTDSRGYLGGYQGDNNSTYGRTRGNQTTNGSNHGAGGSHGGYGGMGNNGIIGIAYDDLCNPMEPGSGGGAHDGNHRGGNGGGLIRMMISGTLTNNGMITANGASPGGYVAGGGAGGGIYVDAGTLSGNGAITANGGAGGTYGGYAEGGGGGGRIAIYYATDTFSGAISAYGGNGNNGGNNAGAGTIFRKQNTQTYGDIEVRNIISTPDISTPTPFEIWRGTSDASGGITSTLLTDSSASWVPGVFVGFTLNPNLKQNTTFPITGNTATTITVSGDMTGTAAAGDDYAVARRQFDTVTLGGNAYVGLDDFVWSAAAMRIEDSAVLTHVNTGTDSVSVLDMVVNDLTIGTLAQINASGRGYLGAYQGGNNSVYGRTGGNVITNGSRSGAGGSHGGLGGNGANGVVGLTYDDPLDPLESGAGGGAWDGNHRGGNGGGLIRLFVYDALTNNGVIAANGASPGGYVAGGGAGGGIYIYTGTLDGGGIISANGSAGGTFGGYAEGGGGGGRIVVYITSQNNYAGQVFYDGGNGNNGGGNGQIGTFNLENVSPDSDEDSMNDAWERHYFGDLSHDGTVDTDDDGLNDLDEFLATTDPTNDDTDSDTMKDGWEADNNLNPLVDDGSEDPDNDDLMNADEFIYQTDPNDPDSDNDGYSDGEEVAYGSDPRAQNSIPVLGPGSYYTDADYEKPGIGTLNAPWQTLHRAIGLINSGTPGTYALYVDTGWYRAEAAGGHEPDSALFVMQDNLDILGQGVGATVVDGQAAGIEPGNFPWTDGIDIQSSTNVTIQHIEIKNFTASGVHLGSAVNCKIETCALHDNAINGVHIEYGFGTQAAPSSGNWIQSNCNVFNNGYSGIYIYDSPGNQVVANMGSIYDNGTASQWGTGIWITGLNASNNVIASNRMYYSGSASHKQKSGIIISGGGAGNQVVGNVILGHGDMANKSGAGIEVNSADVVIAKNFIYDNIIGISVYDSMKIAAPSIINNLVYNGPQNRMLWGIWAEAFGYGVYPVIYHNTIDGGGQDGIYLNRVYTPMAPEIKFNIISNFGLRGIYDVNGSAELQIDYNDVWNNGDDQTIDNYVNCLPGTNDINVAPNYNNPENGDYHLQAGALCINAIGPGQSTVAEDLEGISRPQPSGGNWDMGCYEKSGTVNAYTVNFIAGSNGSISENASQNVSHGADSMPVSAVASPGYHFVNWTWDNTSSADNPLIITNVTSNMTITANFEINQYEVTYTAGLGGTVSGNASQFVSHGGNTASVAAVPDTGYHFIHWEDSAGNTLSDNPLILTNVTSNLTIRAAFDINHYTVSFINTSGGGISGDATQIIVHAGNAMTVTAIPATGYEFAGWSGDYSGLSNPLTISNVTANMNIYANFRQKEAVTHTVTFTTAIGGKLSGNPVQTVADGGNCTPVEAIPDEGYGFAGWSGGFTGNVNPVAIANVTADMTITAHFQKKTYSVNASSTEGGHIDGIPADPIEHGSMITLTATPDDGHTFAGWSGDYSGPANPLIVSSVTSNLNFVAHFSIKTYTVTFIAGIGGKVAGDKSQTISHGGRTSEVSAQPVPGYEFAGWTGDSTGMENPLTLSGVISDMSIAANFEEIIGNLPPAQPTPESPVDHAVIPPGSMELISGAYSDPEHDTHTRTWWQARPYGDPDLILDEKSVTDLTSYLIPTGFEPGLQYEWRAAYQDAGSGQYSPWSQWADFTVGQLAPDENIPPVEPGIQIKDYKMISFIQWAQDPSAEAVFGPMMEEGYNEKEYRIGTYDSNLGFGGYREYADFTVEPGRCYWFLARQGLELTLSGVPVSTSVDFCVQLKFNAGNANGWNMVAPPNNADYHWGDLQVMEKDASGNVVFGPVPVSQLTAGNEYLDIRIWSWADGSYTSTSDVQFLLKRYEGYWVRAKKPGVFLCFPASVQVVQISPKMMIAAWIKEVKDRVKENIFGMDTAFADISTDNPPMPMGGFDGSPSGGGSGCFISTIRLD